MNDDGIPRPTQITKPQFPWMLAKRRSKVFRVDPYRRNLPLQFICFSALSLADCFLLVDTTSGDLEKPQTLSYGRSRVNLSLAPVSIAVSFSCRIMLLRNNTLKIVNSSRADEGSYMCRAENQLGSAEMTASLWVKGKPCPWGRGLFGLGGALGIYFLPN